MSCSLKRFIVSSEVQVVYRLIVDYFGLSCRGQGINEEFNVTAEQRNSPLDSRDDMDNRTQITRNTKLIYYNILYTQQGYSQDENWCWRLSC